MRLKVFLFTLFLVSGLVRAENSSAQNDNSYGLSAGDILKISVWRDDNLSGEMIVPPDGIISFPLIGDIDAKDLTIPELRKILEEKLDPFVPDPTVTVVLGRADSMIAYVVGKVQKPGRFQINMNTSVLQLLAMAGGLTPYAASDKILILRQQGEETSKIVFNYKQLEKGEALESNIAVKRGDVVLVP